MRADCAPANDGRKLSDTDAMQAWLKERDIEDVEAFVPDMAGAARVAK